MAPPAMVGSVCPFVHEGNGFLVMLNLCSSPHFESCAMMASRSLPQTSLLLAVHLPPVGLVAKRAQS
jgi:hypothetical protein